MLCALALLLSLGFWQLRRLGEKQALLARIETRIHQVPAPIPPTGDWPKLNLADLEYRPLKLHGTYLNDKEVLVFEPAGKVSDELVTKGYLILTPLQLTDGGIVIVNRGFVTDDKAAPTSRLGGQITGETDVTGLLRLPQRRNFFTPADEPGKNLWFTSDPAAIAKVKGLDGVAPFLVDADATANPGGWPRGGTTEIDIPNRHLEYAVTWFGLALTLLGVYAFFARALWLNPRQNTYPDHVL